MIRVKNTAEHDLVVSEGRIPSGATVDIEDDARALFLIKRNPYLKRIDEEKVVVFSAKKEESVAETVVEQPKKGRGKKKTGDVA